MSIVTFTLKSAASQVAAPFSLGHAFKQGDVPSGAQLVASIADFQCAPKNTWPDGSLKFAVLTGRAVLTANVVLSVPLSIGTPAAGTALTTADLKATGVTASLACGSFGTVSWVTTDWDSPFETWTSGPRSSSWRYRKPVGSDPHLVGWLEVTLFAGGEVEVLPWIENGYTRVAAPTNKAATYVFTLGGTSRCSVAIDLKHHQRTPVINGTALSYWLGTDPGVTPAHDKAYLQSTELVPTYSGVLDPTTNEATRLVSTYVPLQAGDLAYDSEYMGSTGYQRPIGLMPACDVVYLTSTAANAYAAAVRNGFSAGRFTSHFRDEATNKPILFSSYPNFALQDNQGFRDNGGSTTADVAPTIVGGSNHPISWDTAHSPLVGYLAYLVTGRKYFAEETQFAANYDYIGQGDNSVLRNGDQGLMRPRDGAWQTRAAAWQWRTRSAALAITPDADTALRAEYARTIENTIDSFHAKYIAQPNNPWGIIEPGEMYDADNYRTVAIWQQDFYTAAMGWSICQSLPISAPHATKLAALFQWKAKSVVLRLGTSDKFWYVNPMPYQMAVSPPSATLIDYVTGAGPWLANEAAIYDGTYNPLRPAYQGGHFSTTEGVLQGEYTPAEWVTGMLGNAMPAISYAVRHGVAGAAAGYARLTGASNWPDVVTNFNLKPGWSVQPASVGVSLGAAIATIPMDSVSLLATGVVMDTNRSFGLLASEIPTIGTEPHPLANDVDGSDPVGTRYAYEVTTVPAGLTTFSIAQNGGINATGPNGLHVGFQTTKKSGVQATGVPLTIQIGAATSTITGISISPTTATGATTFTKTVTGTGSFSSAATFSKLSGNGAIDTVTGVFTPPAQTGSVQVTIVRVTSTQDPTWHADATITIPALASTITGVTLAPLNPVIAAGASKQFTGAATGTGGFSPAVDYSVVGVSGATGGSINASGLFTATLASSDRTFIVVATSQQDSSWSATTSITVSANTSVITTPRYARPVSDIAAGAWTPSTGSSLFAMLDEPVADSTDFISATTATTASVALNPVTDPNTSANQTVRYQAWAPTSGSLTVRLKQGATVIASWSHASLPTTPTIYAQSLTGPQCDAITDYAALALEFVAA